MCSSAVPEAGVPKPHRHLKGKSFAHCEGSALALPGFYRFRARMPRGRNGSSMMRASMRVLLLALLVPVFCAVGGNGTVEVHVVNGKNGKPIASAHVLVFQGGSTDEVRQLKHPLELRTDSDGVAVLPSDSMPWLRVSVDWHRSCQSDPGGGIYSLATIRDSGLVTPNTCSSITRKASPDTLYLFMRDETFLEKMRH